MLIFYYWKFNPYRCIVSSVWIQNGSLSSVTFWPQCSIVWKYMSSIELMWTIVFKIRKRDTISYCISRRTTWLLDFINSHSICTDKTISYIYLLYLNEYMYIINSCQKMTHLKKWNSWFFFPWRKNVKIKLKSCQNVIRDFILNLDYT